MVRASAAACFPLVRLSRWSCASVLWPCCSRVSFSLSLLPLPCPLPFPYLCRRPVYFKSKACSFFSTLFVFSCPSGSVSRRARTFCRRVLFLFLCLSLLSPHQKKASFPFLAFARQLEAWTAEGAKTHPTPSSVGKRGKKQSLDSHIPFFVTFTKKDLLSLAPGNEKKPPGHRKFGGGARKGEKDLFS